MPRKEPHHEAWQEWCRENKIQGGAMPQWLGSLGDWAKGIAPDLWKDHGKEIVKKILVSAGPLALTALGVPPGLSKLVTDYAIGQVDRITIAEANKAVKEARAVTKKATKKRVLLDKAVEAEKKRPPRRSKKIVI